MSDSDSTAPSIANRATLFGTGSPVRRYGTTTLPVCGQTVRFQSLTEGELSEHEMDGFERGFDGRLLRDESGRLLSKEESLADSRGRLIIACLVDGEGNRFLSEKDIELVRQMDGQDTMHLAAALREHCGLDRPSKKN